MHSLSLSTQPNLHAKRYRNTISIKISLLTCLFVYSLSLAQADLELCALIFLQPSCLNLLSGGILDVSCQHPDLLFSIRENINNFS